MMQLCLVDVNGETFSPLLWSLRDGSFALARFIISDLLKIRKFPSQVFVFRHLLIKKIMFAILRTAHCKGFKQWKQILWRQQLSCFVVFMTQHVLDCGIHDTAWLWRRGGSRELLLWQRKALSDASRHCGCFMQVCSNSLMLFHACLHENTIFTKSSYLETVVLLCFQVTGDVSAFIHGHRLNCWCRYRECAFLLEETVFDGLLWHSKDVEDGMVRVNYYIREMYGDPAQEPNVWKHPLAVLVGNGTTEMFEHPVTALIKHFFALLHQIVLVIMILFHYIQLKFFIMNMFAITFLLQVVSCVQCVCRDIAF
jgi:hypothetical protein